MKEIGLGVDIGGSHITSALLDLKTRTIISSSRKRAHVNSNGTVDEIIDVWSGVIQQSFGNNIFNSQKIGIALPGPCDYDLGISLMKDNAKYQSLYGKNIKQLLAQSLQINSFDISLINDAAAFLKGESFSGAAIGCKRAIGLTLGTGLGTSTFSNKIAVDANLWCSDFRETIAEDYLSTRWFVKRYQELSGHVVNGVKEIASVYQSDQNVQTIFQEFAENLSQFLLFFIKKENPEIIVIGGNIMHNEILFIPQVKKHLESAGTDVPIVRALLGEDAAIIGAATL